MGAHNRLSACSLVSAAPQVARDVFRHVGWTIPTERTQLYPTATLAQEPVAPRTRDTPPSNPSELIFIEQDFELCFSATRNCVWM
jgi:hypothetical protein